jgi:hypothetical protein
MASVDWIKRSRADTQRLSASGLPRLPVASERSNARTIGDQSMKPPKHAFIFATVACLITWSVGTAQAAFITVDAVLDHPDLTRDNPINWSVMFPNTLTAIHGVRLDTYLVQDGLDSGETLTYWGVQGDGTGFGVGGVFHLPVFS